MPLPQGWLQKLRGWLRRSDSQNKEKIAAKPPKSFNSAKETVKPDSKASRCKPRLTFELPSATDEGKDHESQHDDSKPELKRDEQTNDSARNVPLVREDERSSDTQNHSLRVVIDEPDFKGRDVVSSFEIAPSLSGRLPRELSLKQALPEHEPDALDDPVASCQGVDPEGSIDLDAEWGPESSEVKSPEPGRSLENSFLRPWNVAAVERADLPLNGAKPVTSDITDLGDKGYWASSKAKSHQSPSEAENADQEYDLEKQLFNSLIRAHQEKKGFFPRPLLSSLINKRAVSREVNRSLRTTHSPDQISAIAHDVCEEITMPTTRDDDKLPKIKSFKKIFAILILLGKVESIGKFLSEDVNDLDLPLVKEYYSENSQLFELRASRDPGKTLHCFDGWKQAQLLSFEEWQWTTNALYFHKGVRKKVDHFNLPPSAILPFTTDSRRRTPSDVPMAFEGGYGQVFKVDIHPDHHDFRVPKSQSFAVKRLHSQDRESFKKEVEILKYFSDDAHPHLISLLATYEQFNVYFLIFPWAESNLAQYWENFKHGPKIDLRLVKWVAAQCKGLANGLATIHKKQTSNEDGQVKSDGKVFGRHGDIKPENILWFDDPNGGILKISDFGLADYNTIRSKSQIPKSRVATSAFYRPPECDLQNGTIDPSYDIWTLGCLYLEFLTWLLGGGTLVKQFEESRMSVDRGWWGVKTATFYLISHENSSDIKSPVTSVVKPAVKEFIEELHAHEACTQFVHDFIDMIERDMLLVKPTNPEDKGRVSSLQLSGNLVTLLEKCEDHTYACKPVPSPRKPQSAKEAARSSATYVQPVTTPKWENFQSYTIDTGVPD